MDDSTLVEIANGVNDGRDDISGLFLSVYNFLSNLIIQLSTWEVLQHQVDVLLIDKVIVELDDVWVLYILHYVYLSLE